MGFELQSIGQHRSYPKRHILVQNEGILSPRWSRYVARCIGENTKKKQKVTKTASFWVFAQTTHVVIVQLIFSVRSSINIARLRFLANRLSI